MGVLRFIKKFYFLINILFCLFSLLVFQVVQTAEIKHWLGGFLMLCYPLVLAGNLLFFLSYIFVRPLKSLLSLATLFIVSQGLLSRTFKFIPKDIRSKQQFSFSLVSYNLMYGDKQAYKDQALNVTANKQSAILDTLAADIFCFQEFYNNSEYENFRLIKKLAKRYPYFVFIDKNPNHVDGKGSVGLVTFSRFPIVHKEEFYWPPNNNGILSSDIVVNKDTVRVINVHMRSMGIRVQKVLNGNNIDANATKNILGQLKSGFQNRGIQMNVLEKWIKESPYPVIVSGDLNELPYGYVYGRLSKNLKNGQEESGFGFGFTYQKILSFLRIDNQFFDPKKIEILYFETLSYVPFSDHYPIKGWYRMKP